MNGFLLPKWKVMIGLFISICLYFAHHATAQTTVSITGRVTDEKGETLPGVTVKLKGTDIGGVTNQNGQYSFNITDANGTLVFSYLGFTTKEEAIKGRTAVNISLQSIESALDEVVVTGYGVQKKESVTGAISGVSAKDIDKVRGGATVSSALAGKLPGVSFRMPDGRPGAGATIQIRNMGNPLYVIDGIQQDAGQFNNISPNDIETINVLKDASAAIYGVRAANGVVVVTTKRGRTGSQNTISIDAYTGWQNWSRFPETTNAYEWMLGKADAEMNFGGNTEITPEELEKWRVGTEYGYQNMDWYDLIIVPNAPQSSLNISTSGGSDKINYYLSGTHLDQKGVYGSEREFLFKRTNIQSNVDAKVSERIKVGVQINGRVETRDQPGVPGGDDYWAARFALFRNRPTEQAYANGNPLYPNDIGHNTENWAVQTKDISGYWRSDWRVLQSNFNAEYTIPGIEGLTLKGMYSYYIADNVINGHEFTYDVYTYHPETDVYEEKVGSSNPYRERRIEKRINQVYQTQLTYNNTFGKHTVGGILVAERYDNFHTYTFQHAVPRLNTLPLLQFNSMDAENYSDIQEEEARLGYIGRLNYSFDDRYYVELSGRQDASWKFAPGKRSGFFPSASAGWRITNEKFMKSLLGDNSVLNDLKIRASYGVLGDDDIGIDPFAYISGYNYNSSSTILGGNVVIGARDRGVPITNLSWFKSKITDVGADFALFNNKLTGSLDYFYRKRTGLRGSKYDILIPSELGYSLPDENVNSDAQFGGEGSLAYQNKIGNVGFTVSGNLSYSRSKFLESYKPVFNNSLDRYRASGESRYNNMQWGLEVIGQFQSQDEINNYPVNIDGKNNSTLLPGSFIYKDFNGDGLIDGYDERPIGYTTTGQPNIMFGFSLGLTWKAFDFSADFSGGGLYSWNQNWEQRWAFQNGGALKKVFYEDRWHRADVYDLNSEWIPGKYPALSFNNGSHSDYRTSTFWMHNVRYLRARTIQLGYSLPKALLAKVKIERARVYINGYNLFSIDNLKEHGVDPEIADDNGLQYPQNRFVNVGVNLTF